jgi:DNA polymerase II small subunit/DNA polymerase delta subunit B
MVGKMNKELISKLREILQKREDTVDFDFDDLEEIKFDTIKYSKRFVDYFSQFYFDFKNESIAKEIIDYYKEIYEEIWDNLFKLNREVNVGRKEILDELEKQIIKNGVSEFMNLFKEVYSE